jgi:PadR family transcriptional regulator PadR
MAHQAQLRPGTLDLLIIKAVSLGPLHSYGMLMRIATRRVVRSKDSKCG